MNSTSATADLDAARRRDEDAFARLVKPHRRGLQAHCYRMLGSVADAEDALQESLLRAWRGLPRFEGRSSLKSWLYRIATNVCIRALERRPKRILPPDERPAGDPRAQLDPPLAETVWLEPYPDEGLEGGLASPEARYEQRESVELAFIAALQHLPERQRAVLLLRDVLGFAPAEIAETLETTPASVYSVLQRAHQAIDDRLPDRSQQATLHALGDDKLKQIVTRFVTAWEEADVDAIAAMLTEDVTFAMPPRPTWFRGREAVRAFLPLEPLRDGRFWRTLPVEANGQLAFAGYGLAADGVTYVARVIEVLTLDADGMVTDWMTFHGAVDFARFGLPATA